jgi:membrane-bound hydrogenase subunit beta
MTMTPEAILQALSTKLGEEMTALRTVEYRHGSGSRPILDLWVEVPLARLHDAIEALCSAGSAHVTVISGDDLGDRIALNYHLNLGWGELNGEIAVAVRTYVPADDLRIPTITDLIPGALTAEREKHEFYGIVVDGIPDDRNLFLPEDMTIHPWRKDEESMKRTEPMVKRLVKWETRDA